MKSFLKSAGLWVLTSLLSIWAGVKFVLDWIGRSTLPEDWKSLMDEKLPVWASWLFSTPWWFPAGLAAALTLWMMWITRPRPLDLPVNSEFAPTGQNLLDDPSMYSNDPEGEALDKQAYNEIVAFCIDVLLPACQALDDLAESLMHRLCGNETVAILAVNGFREGHYSGGRAFWESHYKLSNGLTASPGPCIRFETIIECINDLERKSYKLYYDNISDLAKKSGIDLGQDKKVRAAWEEWRERHNALVAAYEPIQRDIRFGKLHRLRSSRWGGVLEPSGPF